MIARNIVYKRALLTLATSLLCACSSYKPSNVGAAPEGEVDNQRITVTRGVLARLEAKPDQVEAVARFIEGGLPIVEQEPGTLAWFGLRLGPTTFGIFDAFADDAGRSAHVNGKIPAALMKQKDTLLAAEPSLEMVDVLASKLPKEVQGNVSVGLVATLKAQAGKERDMEDFLKGGAAIVEDEPGTTVWFALRGDDFYGVFDAFASEEGRNAHLEGKIPAALGSEGKAFIEGAPSVEKVDVSAAKRPR